MRPTATTTRATDTAPTEPIRVLRVIARLNVGGPARHVTVLGSRIASGVDALLVHGEVGPGEESLANDARDAGCRTLTVPALGPELDPVADSRALRHLISVVREVRPHIVETHTAKAGMLGRLAARAVSPRPAVVHTYHGHVLEGYFGPARNAIYRTMERRLARSSDVLVAVSQATVDDLVRLRVAPPERFRVIPLGLDLGAFADVDRAAVIAYRARSGVRGDELLIGYVGRVVPIKRLDILLHAFALLLRRGVRARLAIAGDGESRAEAERLAADLGIADRVVFHGFVSDAPVATAAADIAVLSSDNEGTPVSLIEAGAAGVPSVATRVGGVPEVLPAGTGLLVPPRDPAALSDGLATLCADPELRRHTGAAARSFVTARFGVERMLADIESLYGELAGNRPQRERK